jgi:hypothetical protein
VYCAFCYVFCVLFSLSPPPSLSPSLYLPSLPPSSPHSSSPFHTSTTSFTTSSPPSSLPLSLPLSIPLPRYELSPTALRTALESHPKATCMIFCNPSNPTGRSRIFSYFYYISLFYFLFLNKRNVHFSRIILDSRQKYFIIYFVFYLLHCTVFYFILWYLSNSICMSIRD